MIKKILICLVFVIQISSLLGQSTQDKNKAFQFIDSVLGKDSITLSFIELKYPDDVIEISLRLQIAISENKEWFEKYMNQYYKTGEGLPYHENFGITPEEYQKIKDLEKKPASSFIKLQRKVSLHRNSETISFAPNDDESKFIEFIKLDLKNQLLLFLNDSIQFSNHFISSPTTALGQWDGYIWKKQISTQMEDGELKFDTLTYTMVEIIFGRVNNTNKTVFRFQYKSIDNGSVKANYEAICYID